MIIEEDIIVLQGVLSQLEKTDVNKSRPWQTDWPNQSTPNTGNSCLTKEHQVQVTLA